MQPKRSGEMLTLKNLPVAVLTCSALPATQTTAVCLFWPALHLRMGIPPPPAYSKTQVSGSVPCVSPCLINFSPSGSTHQHTHTLLYLLTVCHSLAIAPHPCSS